MTSKIVKVMIGDVDYKMDADSITKEASVGMIIGQGDPSSPPSGIFMSEDERLANWYGATIDSLILDLEE